MSISSHTGMVILVVVGMAAIIGVIIIALIEAKRGDSENLSIPSNTQQMPNNKKRN